MYKSQIVSGGFPLSGCNSSEVLPPVETTLDLVTILVEIIVYLSFSPTVTLGGDDRISAPWLCIKVSKASLS